MKVSKLAFLSLSILFLCMTCFVWGADDATLWDQAQAKYQSGDLSEAADLLSQLLDQFPSSPKAPPAQLQLARIKLKQTPEDTQGLLTAFNLVKTKYPSSPEVADASVHIGYLHSRTDATQAIKDFKDFLATYQGHDQCARVTRALGGLYLRNLDLDNAEKTFDSVKSIKGASPDLVDESTMQSGFVKIMRYYHSKDRSQLETAVDILSKVTASSSKDVQARAQLGAAEATLLLGQVEEAGDKYEAAVQACGDQPYYRGIALYGAALSSEEAGKIEQAADGYAALLKMLSGSSIAEKDAAWQKVCLSSIGDRAQVAVKRDGTWKRFPGGATIQESVIHQGRCLYLMGRFDDAIKVLSELEAYTTNSWAKTRATRLKQRCQNAKGGPQR